MVASERFFVHDRVIGRYTLPGGAVFNYARSISVEVERAAKLAAPVRTGRLRNSIGTSSVGSNQYGTNWRVTAGSGHALFVSRGTRGKTISRRRKPMRLYGSFPGGWLNTPYARYQGAPRWHVDGQLPNPYLQEALRAVLVQHGLI